MRDEGFFCALGVDGLAFLVGVTFVFGEVLDVLGVLRLCNLL